MPTSTIKQDTFWDGLIAPVPKRNTKSKTTPPPRTWEEPDYLPNLAEAQAATYERLTNADLIEASNNGDMLVFDIESYPNYFLLAFKSMSTGRVRLYEVTDNNLLDAAEVKWIMSNITTVGFNSINYDLPMLAIAVSGAGVSQLYLATKALIEQGERPSAVLRANSAQSVTCDHIDLIEVAPLSASLKIYGGRMHCHTMQDLPFKVGTVLTNDQIDIIRWYCINDLAVTEQLYQTLEGEIELRKEMGKQYGVDLRSKSDAQIAESVITDSIRKITGFKPPRPPVLTGQVCYYKRPDFVSFKDPNLMKMLDEIEQCGFRIAESGHFKTPQYLLDKVVRIGSTFYNLGMGGLHSMEKRMQSIKSNKTYTVDMDVASYYPAIILRCGLYPQQLGVAFLTVYGDIVVRRLTAKAVGEILTASTLKITINGSFGKFGSMHSALYSPDLLIQVTLTGQLCLLMLIEALEDAGIKVVSANTDGIVAEVGYDQQELLQSIRFDWEDRTTFIMESTFYERLQSRDVNNYMALTTSGEVKGKGVFGKPDLRKNPSNEICIIAIEELLKNGTPVDVTIKECQDITKFLTVRTVKGGAVKAGEYLGKAVRWYYSKYETGTIIYANTGNKVPKSEGAKPMMTLTDNLPTDIDYDYYVRETNIMLDNMCFH